MTQCEACHVAVKASANDPVVTASSLGRGAFHYACAKRRWREIAEGRRRDAREQRLLDAEVVIDMDVL